MGYKENGQRSAFSRAASTVVDVNGKPDFGVPGMVKREYMATHIMQGIVGGLAIEGIGVDQILSEEQLANLTDNAILLADTLLQRLSFDT